MAPPPRATLLLRLPLLALLALAAASPPLPRLYIAGPLTVSGFGAGADFASQFHVAYADTVLASAAFAGQAPSCATTRFAGEAVVAGGCLAQAPGERGPGCSGLPTTGAAPCVGCPDGTTLQLDHCKLAGAPNATVVTLVALTAQAAALGLVAPLTHFADFHKVFAFRGARDSECSLQASSAVIDFFVALGVNSRDARLVSNGTAAHGMPTTDPAVPSATCGGPEQLQNCGYDGAGAVFTYLFADLVVPPPGAAAVPSNLLEFNQALYEQGVVAGFAASGLLYVPTRCVAGAHACALHVVFHGCGQQQAAYANLSFALHAGFAQWADANDFVLLLPQMGGFAERGAAAAEAVRHGAGHWWRRVVAQCGG